MKKTDVQREINSMTENRMNEQDELSACVREFFEKYLNRVEESDSGKEFHPITVNCCRAMMIKPLDELLDRMASLSGAARRK